MGPVLDIASKDLRQLVRDRGGLFWALAFPLVASILFGSIFDHDGSSARPIPIALVDQDGSPASRRTLDRLTAVASLEVEAMDRARAVEAVRTGRMAGYVVIGAGYSAPDRFLTVDPGVVELGTDPSKPATAAILHGAVMETVYQEMRQLLGDREAMQKAVRGLALRLAGGQVEAVPVGVLASLEQFLAPDNLTRLQAEFSFERPRVVAVVGDREGRPGTSYEITFPQSTGWALIAVIAFFATVIARERESGTLMRLRLAPISMTTIVAGKGLAALVASLSIMLVVLAVGVVGFDLELDAPAQLAMALACSSFSAAGLILLFANLGRTAQAVEGATWTVMIPLFMVGGGMLPLVFMPRWLQTLSNFSPLKWNLYAVEGAVWREFSLTEMLLPCGILVAIGLVAFALGGLLLARSRT